MRLRMLVLALIFSGSLVAHADVIYTFLASNDEPVFAGTYSFHEPAILTSDTTVPITAVKTTNPLLEDIVVDPMDSSCPNAHIPIRVGPLASCFELDFTNGDIEIVFFRVPLTSLGDYGGPAGGGDFSITSTDATVPEPQSLVLLTTGMLAAFGLARRRLRS